MNAADAHDPRAGAPGRQDPGPEAMLALLARLPGPTRANMVRMYLASLDEHLAHLDAGLGPQVASPSPSQTLVDAAHRVAGAAGMMQDSALCEVARAIERALRDDVAEEAQDLLPRLQARAEETRRALLALG